MSGLLDRLIALHGTIVYVIVGALVLAEDAVFVGFVIPGETAAVLGGVAAGLGHVSLVGLTAVVVLTAIVGDSINYEIGYRLGDRLLETRPLRHRRHRLDRAAKLLARRGGRAVFLGRFIAFLRAVMPALAGMARMPYRRFLVWNVAGGLVWGVGSVLAGYLAGNSYHQVTRYLGRGTAIILAVVVVGGLIGWRIRVHRRGNDDQDGSTGA